MQLLVLLAIGLVAGVFSGMFGIGGGLVIVPALLLTMKTGEHLSIGTSLAALIPPVGLLGAIEYHRNGFVNLKYAALIAIGLFLGAYFGAKFMISLSPAMVRKVYAGFLMVVALRMLLMSR